MEDWQARGLATLHLAHSAVADHPAAYVQHALTQASDAIWPLLQSGAQIFVCGDGRRMAPAVRDAFIAMHQNKSGSDRDTASLWLEGLIDEGRYHQDVYGFGK
jgi:cytochrome P450 / NADPH-cytochrome P450 reductase